MMRIDWKPLAGILRLRSASDWGGMVRGALGLAMVMAMAACAVEAGVVPPGRCLVDGDCHSGRRCHASSLCVAADVTPLPVLVHLKPPKASGLVDDQFEVVVDSQSGLQPTDLVLAEPAVVRGKAVRGGDLMAQSVPGTLMATAAGKVAGHGLSYSAVAGHAQAGAWGDNGGYELRLPVGHAYDLAFWPESDVIPPYYATVVANASLVDWNLELPGPAHLVRLRGVVRWAGAPAAGMQLVLEDGLGRVRSRQATCTGGGSDGPETCAPQGETGVDGSFLLLIDPAALTPDDDGAGKIKLHVRPPASTVPLPRGRLPLAGKVRAALREAALAAGAGAAVEMGKVDLGDPGVALDLDVLVRGPDGKPVPGAWVLLEQQMPGPSVGGASLHISVNGSADAKGIFHARLPTGPVKVSVSPLAKSTAGAISTLAQVNGSAILVSCPPRGVLAGRLTDEAGVALAQAQVSLHRLGPTSGDGADAEDVSTPLLTNGQGTFSGAVDAGTYSLWVEPVDSAGLPRALLREVTVAAGADLKLELVVPAPAVFSGRVRSANGAALAGVVVELLSEAPLVPLHGQSADAQPSAVAAQHDSHVLATTVSDASGLFTALVAPAAKSGP